MPESAEPRQEVREGTFWDQHVPSLAECLRELERGPDPNTAAMLDAVEPLAGARVLDFACGAGITSAWLAARGATVVGIDVSSASVARAAELAAAVGADATFMAGSLGDEGPPRTFDRIVGRYALHHVDCEAVAPLLASRLAPDGIAAFVETMASNPVLRAARTRAGSLGIPRYGTPDEHPLARTDLATLRKSFGQLELRVAELRFLRIFDRQVLGYRHRRVSYVLSATDDLLLALGLRFLAYHQVLVLREPRPARP